MTKKFFYSILWILLICTVLCGSKNAAAQPPEFTIGSANNVTTTAIVIPVTTKNFNQILGWQGSINWDNNKITFAGVSAPVSQLSGIQFNASVSSGSGRLSFVWVENNLTPQTIAENTILFSISFNVVNGATGSSNVNFSNNPTALLVSNASGSAIGNVKYFHGVVDFPGVSPAPEFYIGSLTNVTSGPQVITVTTKNFGQLLAWQGSINWDNTKITYGSVSTPASQLSGMDFNASVSGSTGRLSFVWSEANLIPQTIADTAILFSITFNVAAGAAGITDIVFASSPTQLVLSDAYGSPVNNVAYNKGSVAFPGAGLPPAFIIGSAYNVSTSTFSIPVTTKNFVDILGWQGSINWDNSKFTYTGVSALHAKLNGMLFNPSVSGNTGRLSFLWSDNNVIPQSIPDTAVLFIITYNRIDSTGSTDINFTNTPTPLVVSNASGANVPNVVYSKGIITFSKNVCPGGSGTTTITSNITGINYQWQQKTDSTDFVNITDNAFYTGTNTITLTLKNIPANRSGNKYRCIVNGLTSNEFQLRFRDYWNGADNGVWSDLSNWSCPAVLPDAFTDVILSSGNVILNVNTTVKSITINIGANLAIQEGKSVVITGR